MTTVVCCQCVSTQGGGWWSACHVWLHSTTDTTLWCDILLYDVYSMMWYTTLWYDILLYVMIYYSMLCCQCASTQGGGWWTACHVWLHSTTATTLWQWTVTVSAADTASAHHTVCIIAWWWRYDNFCEPSCGKFIFCLNVLLEGLQVQFIYEWMCVALAFWNCF